MYSVTAKILALICDLVSEVFVLFVLKKRFFQLSYYYK